MEAITLLQLIFDTLLGFTLLWLAWQALSSPDLFRAIVLFIAFGLLMALTWVRLNAPDIALAEAAIGAGLTGALLLSALARLKAKNSASIMTEQVENKPLFWLLLTMLSLAVTSGLAFSVLTLQENSPGLSIWVLENIETSGVSNPVTAVLLNYRGYDTLLEMSVLLVALLGIWSLGGVPKRHDSFPGQILNILIPLLVPLLIMVAGYLLWAGAHAPGGAFQAGSLLGAAGILFLLVGWQFGTQFMGLPLRIMITFGLALFIAVGVALMLFGNQFLEYPSSLAGSLIFLIEAAATLSIGITLAALFLGGRPGLRRHK